MAEYKGYKYSIENGNTKLVITDRSGNTMTGFCEDDLDRKEIEEFARSVINSMIKQERLNNLKIVKGGKDNG